MLLKDNQLSTVLLLVALGFLIYYLSKPNENKNATKSEAQIEAFADAASSNGVPVTTEGTPVVVTAPVAEPVISEPVISEPVISEPVITAPVSATPAGPSSAPDVPAPYSESQDGSGVTGMTGPSQARPITLPSDTVFNYQPSDSSMDGAGLDEAFARPLPPGARLDVVDINRNNVTKYDAKDFLPKEINNQWFDTDFSQAKFNIRDDKLINTERYVVGINTVGQSLKNASYDIRGTIPNPKFSVSPWNNSTIEPDYNIKPLC